MPGEMKKLLVQPPWKNCSRRQPGKSSFSFKKTFKSSPDGIRSLTKPENGFMEPRYPWRFGFGDWVHPLRNQLTFGDWICRVPNLHWLRGSIFVFPDCHYRELMVFFTPISLHQVSHGFVIFFVLYITVIVFALIRATWAKDCFRPRT